MCAYTCIGVCMYTYIKYTHMYENTTVYAQNNSDSPLRGATRAYLDCFFAELYIIRYKSMYGMATKTVRDSLIW